MDWLPPLQRPAAIVGTVTAQAARDTGLPAGTPVCCGATDTVMEVFASGAVRPGQMTVKLATAGRICVVTDRPVPHRDLVNYSHVARGCGIPVRPPSRRPLHTAGIAIPLGTATRRWTPARQGYRRAVTGCCSIPI